MDLAERQQFGAFEILEALPEDFLRHAIAAPEVATVGHRHP